MITIYFTKNYFSRGKIKENVATELRHSTHIRAEIEILNGCGEAGIANLFTKFLRSEGYDVIEIKNADNFKYKETVSCTMISGLITGSFLVYLSSAQHVFEELYGLTDTFPYVFAGLALSVGFSTLMNGTLVLRFGMRNLSFAALVAFTVIALSYSLLFLNSQNPSITILLIFLSLQFYKINN